MAEQEEHRLQSRVTESMRWIRDELELPPELVKLGGLTLACTLYQLEGADAEIGFSQPKPEKVIRDLVMRGAQALQLVPPDGSLDLL